MKKKKQTDAFRQLIDYAHRESGKLNRPVVSYLLSMTLAELDGIGNEPQVNASRQQIHAKSGAS